MAQQTTPVQSLNPSSRHASYRLGLIDPSTLASLTVDSLSVVYPAFKLLVPGPDDLPTSLLVDPAFQAGAIVGYYPAGYDFIARCEWTPLAVAEWVARQFSYEFLTHGDYCGRAWHTGYLLGVLTFLAEQDRALALVGMAHLSFWLRLVPSLPAARLRLVVDAARALHDAVVNAYLVLVQVFVSQGLRMHDASRQALSGLGHALTPYAGEGEGA